MRLLPLVAACCLLAVSFAISAPYHGKLVSLDVKDADLRDVLRFLADFGNADLVLDGSVKGRITLKLKSVPWDQAMEIVLKQSGYSFEIIGKDYRGNGITVRPRASGQGSHDKR